MDTQRQSFTATEGSVTGTSEFPGSETGVRTPPSAGGPGGESSRPSFGYTPAPEQPGISKRQFNVLMGVLCGGVCVIGFGVARSMFFPAAPATAQAEAPQVLSPMQEQQRMMREAMQIAREAQQMQRERLDMMRQEMESERDWNESGASADGDGN